MLVFLDPPFENAALYEPALRAAAARAAARGRGLPRGAAALERRRTRRRSAWSVFRYLKAGAVHAHLLQARGIARAA